MKKSLYIAAKDLKYEFRTKQMLNSMLIFSLIVIVIFSISFVDVLSQTELVGKLAPGVLWVAFTFAGTLGLSRSFAGEMENGCLEGLKLSPIDRSSIYIGKTISNAVLMFIVELLTIPIFIVLFNYNISGIPGLALVIFLGTFGFVSVGTLLSALSASTRAREIMLPVLLLPLIIPVIIPAVMATGTILTDGGISSISSELRLLIVYDLIFFVVGQLVFEYTVMD
ncbi:heme exporter protein B [Methanolobus vulcani]|jgi:heme exporter protein B|uniref:Heme exporter protein B n=1 Tax=Methanolobus vulcani TaxID=38026 RepID=A0A7Z7B0T1_9EURY|nr:heme exporter protein CcmB [Methanolobus vulcani]MDK2947998.1 heme exporter protein [Methanolobus sp.]SDG24671.1 heme exporter protein B [Methanolobus vulcani]